MTSPSADQPKSPPSRSRVRGKSGKFIAQLDTAERDAEAARLRVRGQTYQQIADALGYTSEGTAHTAVQRAMKAKPAEVADDVRALEVARLDDLYARALVVAEREHLAHGNGRVVYEECPGVRHKGHVEFGHRVDREGNAAGCRGLPVLDDGPLLAAIDRLIKIQDRRAKLLGLDAPTRHSVDAEALGRDILEMLRGGSTAADDGD